MASLWMTIPRYENYAVSNTGEIRNTKFGRRVKTRTMKNGYISVGLFKGGRQLTLLVHRIVLEAFKGPPALGTECMHLNGRRNDNRIENLNWGSKKENHRHKRIHGTAQIGTKNPNAKWTLETVGRIYRSSKNSLRLAEEIGVPSSTIRQIRCRKTWVHAEAQLKEALFT